MRLFKAILTLAAGCGLVMSGGFVCAQTAPAKSPAPAKQTPAPSKQSTPAPTKATPAPAPAKKAEVPAKKAEAPAKKAEVQTKKAAPPAKAPASQAAPTAPAGTAATAPASAATPIGGADMPVGNRRDPFAALVAKSGRGQRQAPEITCRAPGKGSVAIDTMRVDGVVRQGSLMIAAVRTPQGRVYFLRERDQLCDGRVERITMEGLTLRQMSRDAFGKPIERPVSKRMFPSAGEQR